MQLGYPLGLLAIAGLVVPLIIHLWNIKKGKTIKIGSIALLSESARTSSKSFRITDLLLWILRSLILLFIAFFMAKPNLVQILSKKDRPGWVLIEPRLKKLVIEQHLSKIDSLIKSGYELHYFSPGFEKFALNDTASIKEKYSALNYHALIRQLNLEVPAQSRVYLFADKRIVKLDEQLPSISYQLNWLPVTLADTLTTWQTQLGEKSFEGTSTRNMTKYLDLTSPNPEISVVWFEQNGSLDMGYVKAALAAIAEFSGRNIKISKFDQTKNQQFDVGFWLSDQAIDPAFLSSIKKNGRLLSYENGKIANEQSVLIIGGENTTRIELKKRVEFKGKESGIYWQDGFGNPILTASKVDDQTKFHFYSRFNVLWNDLVWQEQFVQALLPIVINSEDDENFGFENHPSDLRISANHEVISASSETKSAALKAEQKPIGSIFWIFAFILLAIERTLTFKKQKGAYA